MWKEAALTFCLSLVLVLGPAGRAEDAVGSTGSAGVVIAQYGKESSSARIVPARMDGRPGIAVVFEGTDDLHYYAKKETAPAGYKLEIAAASDDFEFGEAVFPRWSIFRDPLGESVEVYAGRFVVFVPIKAPTEVTVVDKGDVEVKISGIACTSQTCLSPFEKALQAAVDWSRRDSWEAISLPKAAGAAPAVQGPSYSVWFALGLAFVAGLALNIMPCVWPVLPIIVMRIVEQARHSRAGSVAMGLVFCLGIVLFFACLAGVNIILQLFYGTVLQWGDQFRNPAFVAGMALLLIVLALFMFGVFTITVPSSIASRSGPGRGYAGALGMGFLAAILSTPCSFGILAAAFAWAQGQHLALGTFAILVIGVGMALPYAILTSVPGLLKRLPRAGRWMELFKQAIGFVLLVIAVKLIAALPEVRRTGVMYFAVILGFCVWMWGGWVGYNTPAVRKWLIRIIAVALAGSAGWAWLPAPKADLIDWQKYDAALIEEYLTQNRPVLIKFTADWCLSCQVVEKTVYSRQDVAKLMEEKGVLAVKADTTVKDYPATLALKNIYNEPGVPVSMLFVPGQKEPVRWRGMAFAEQLKTRLESLSP